MKSIFMYFCGGVLALTVAGWALYMIWESIVQLIRDWQLGRELNALQSESEERREQRRLSNEKRLSTDCQHDFRSGATGLPAGACLRCGMEQDKPSGGCDHIWRVKPGPVPSSVCEKCGKTFNPFQAPQAR